MNVVDGRGRRCGGYDAQLAHCARGAAALAVGLLGGLPGVRQIGTAVYRYVAANRVRQRPLHRRSLFAGVQRGRARPVRSFPYVSRNPLVIG